MKPIQRDEVLGIAEYEQIRERFRGRVIAEKRVRRVALGDKASALFENRDTVLLQIQEMLRTERISKEAGIRHEIETYNKLIPGDDELSCTVMIEIPDPKERDAFLVAARGFERSITLVVDGEPFPAVWELERELPDRTTAVHYLKFPLSRGAADKLRKAGQAGAPPLSVELKVDHPVYRATARLSPATLASIAEDLEAPHQG